MGRVKPRIVVPIGALWPGHESTGPNLSIKAMCRALGDEFDFLLVARDRPFGAAEPMVTSGRWHDLGWATIQYLTVGPNGAAGLAALLRDTPHELLLLNGFFDREFTIPALLAVAGRAMRGLPRAVTARRRTRQRVVGCNSPIASSR